MSIKLYVAGPMQNIPGYNFQAFDDATAVLRRLGFTVISPAERDRERNPEAYEIAKKSPDGKWTPNDTGGLTWAQILAGDIIIIADEVDGVALLPGWERSSGARLEAFVGLLRNKTFGFYHPEDESIEFVDKHRVREILQSNMP